MNIRALLYPNSANNTGRLWLVTAMIDLFFAIFVFSHFFKLMM